MFTKTILAAALVIGAASAAFAGESDPNLLNRYPSFNMTRGVAPIFQSSDVALTNGHTAVGTDQAWFDRASRSTGGGY